MLGAENRANEDVEHTLYLTLLGRSGGPEELARVHIEPDLVLFGLLPPLPQRIRKKREKKQRLAERALETMMQCHPRMAAVVQAVATRAGWGKTLPKGTGMGMAFQL